MKRLFPEDQVEEAKKFFKEEKFAEIGEGILIYPFETESLSQSTYDLRVGKRAISFTTGEKIDVEEKGDLPIHPKEFVGVLTYEYVGLPLSVMGAIRSSTTLVLQGLSHVSTRVHAGYYGNMMVPVCNVGNQIVNLRYKQPFCNIAFEELSPPASEPYRGHYKGLEDIWGPVVSSIRIWEPTRKDLVKPEMMDEVIKMYGPPFDIVAGMFENLEKRIDQKFKDEWGPLTKKDLISYVDKRVIKLLMTITIPLAAAIILALIGIIPLIWQLLRK